MKLNSTYYCSTDGSGYWSQKTKNVKLTDIELVISDFDKDFGELRVYFDRRTWQNRNDGLIYTDNKFLRDLQLIFIEIGFKHEELAGIDYSEQGMQGENYVSFDVNGTFIKAWTRCKDKL